MVREYASQQPQGFKNIIENIAIVGAGGQSGKFMVEEILKAGKHKVTAITRVGSTNKIPEGVNVKVVDYNDQSSLVESLKGQDCLIITMAVTAPADQHTKLIEAAATANVPWIIPNEFGGDGLNEEAGRDTLLGIENKKRRDYIEQLGKSSWIGIACGFWYEFSLGGGPYRFGFDIPGRSVTFYGDGSARLNTSTWPQVGRSVAALLALKVLPDDEKDVSSCLEDFRNTFIYVSSFSLDQRDMFDSVLRVTGTSAAEWKIAHVPVKEYYEAATKQLRDGDRVGFVKMLYSRVFFPDMPSDFEAARGLDNGKLGLPKEDLDEFTKIGVHLAESGYFDNPST